MELKQRVALERCQFGLWACLVVSQRPILSTGGSIFARELCMCVSAFQQSGWFVFLRYEPQRHIHTPQDAPFVQPIKAVQTLYIILFESFYFHPNLNVIYDRRVKVMSAELKPHL